MEPVLSRSVHFRPDIVGGYPANTGRMNVADSTVLLFVKTYHDDGITGEPKQIPGCLYINASTGLWHSGDCAAAAPFICKIIVSCKKPAPRKCEDGWVYNEKLDKCYKAS